MADLTADFVREIAKMNAATAHVVEVGGFSYTNAPNWQLVKKPAPTPLALGSLDGIVAYVNGVADFGDDQPFFHIDNPHRVYAAGGLNEDNDRHCYAVATLVDTGFDFETWMPQEQFIIGLQSRFVETDMLTQLIKVVSSITSEDVRVSMDDGIAQEVTVKASLAKMDRATLPTRITLQPFRTFREVNQPASEFLLRARKDGTGVKLALFEADGGVWAIEAIANIAEFLQANAPGFVVLK